MTYSWQNTFIVYDLFLAHCEFQDGLFAISNHRRKSSRIINGINISQDGGWKWEQLLSKPPQPYLLVKKIGGGGKRKEE